MAIPKPGSAAAYRYNAIPKQPVKKAPVKKAPAVRAKDPYGAVPTIGGLTMTQIQGMTPQQIALWGAYQQSQGPDYSKLPTVNFSKLHQAAVAEAGKETASLVQPYQAEEARLKQNFQVSSQAAANFAAAFSAIAGGGNANIDDPAAQAYALKNFGGSYVGGMAATIGAQLINQQGAYWTEEDAKNAAKIKQITDASPDLAEKIYKSAVDDATEQIKLGKSIADMSFKNKLGAIAALGKAMGGTGSGSPHTTWKNLNGHLVLLDDVTGAIIKDAGAAGAAGSGTSWQTINGHRVLVNDATGTVINDAGSAGVGGKGGGKGPSNTSWQTINGRRVLVNETTGAIIKDAGAAGTGSRGGGPSGSTQSTTLNRADSVGTDVLTTVMNSIAAKAAKSSKWSKDVHAGVMATKDSWFGTAMYRVITAIAPHLKTIGYTPAQIKAEAYRIVTQVGDKDGITLTAPSGYKVPKAKNVSFTPVQLDFPSLSQAAVGSVGADLGGPAAHYAKHDSGENWQSNNAWDIGVPVGTPIYAVSDGVIGSQIGTQSSRPRDGQRLTLAGDSNSYWYAHLSDIVVKAGQRVRAGQLLGYSGASENGAAHLHLAVMNLPGWGNA